MTASEYHTLTSVQWLGIVKTIRNRDSCRKTIVKFPSLNCSIRTVLTTKQEAFQKNNTSHSNFTLVNLSQDYVFKFTHVLHSKFCRWHRLVPSYEIRSRTIFSNISQIEKKTFCFRYRSGRLQPIYEMKWIFQVGSLGGRHNSTTTQNNTICFHSPCPSAPFSFSWSSTFRSFPHRPRHPPSDESPGNLLNAIGFPS